jgi:hypothetical protein
VGKFIDLDALIPEDITVKLGGQEYKIPADLDLATSARLIGLGKKLTEDPSPETVQEFEKFITELLSIRQKPPAAAKMTLTQALALIRAVAGAGQELAEQAAPFAG